MNGANEDLDLCPMDENNVDEVEKSDKTTINMRNKVQVEEQTALQNSEEDLVMRTKLNEEAYLAEKSDA